MLKLNLIHTVVFSGIVLFIGYGLRRVFRPLETLNIPAPVVGGLIVALITLVARGQGVTLFEFDTNPHLHFLVTEGGLNEAGVFHKVSRIDDSKLAELFAREVVGFLVHDELLSPEWAERLLSWRHTGFNVHSRVRAKTKQEAERVGKYMIRPLLSLERLSLDEREGQVVYRYGKNRGEVERLDYPEFIARKTSHIPDKGQVKVRKYGPCANAHRGEIRKPNLAPIPPERIEEEPRPVPSKGWAEMIRKVYEVDPVVCPNCGDVMKGIAFLTDYAVVDRIIANLKLTLVTETPTLNLAHLGILTAAEI